MSFFRWLFRRYETNERGYSRVGASIAIATAVAATGFIVTNYPGGGAGSGPGGGGGGGGSSAPGSPPTGSRLCAGGTDASLLVGPSSAPAGAVTIPAGDNSTTIGNNTWTGWVSNTTYYLAAGTHTLGAGSGNQIKPPSGATIIGAPGAIVDGASSNNFAFVGTSTNVTIKYLTIKNFTAPYDQWIVNHDSGDFWTVSYNTIGPNKAGAGGFGFGDNNTYSYNCVWQNGQYGFNGYNASDGGIPTSNIVLDHNEISTNDVGTVSGGCAQCGYDNYPTPATWSGFDCSVGNCGVSGGGKFWLNQNVTFSNKWVHNNHYTGIWADTLNVGFNVTGNYFDHNWGIAFWYEVSYNASITGNTFYANALVTGGRDSGFPHAAIYISESGQDTRVTCSSSVCSNSTFNIASNVFQDNWGGVTLWENSDRYCSHGLPTVECTLPGAPTTAATTTSCAASSPTGIEPPTPVVNVPSNSQAWDCRWRTKNVLVSGNTFTFSATNVTTELTNMANADAAGGPYSTPSKTCDSASTSCGHVAQVSQWGSFPFWRQNVVPNEITWNQNDQWSNNTYTGPWRFDTMQAGNGALMTFSQWQTTIGSASTTAGSDNVDSINHPAHDTVGSGSSCTGCP